MHELSIAQSIISGVKDVAKENGAERVKKIILEVGALSGVVKDSLLFCFPVAAKDSVVEDADLEIIEIPLTVFCSDCQKESVQQSFVVQCPICESTTVEITRGRELAIKRIDYI